MIHTPSFSKVAPEPGRGCYLLFLFLELKANPTASDYIWNNVTSKLSALPEDEVGREACAASSEILRPRKK